MKPHNFTLSNLDTDSISFCKPDMSPFTNEERLKLVNEVNTLFHEDIQFSDDGFFPRFVVLKAKNYIMLDEKGKLKLKGSALKSSSMEPILKVMLGEFIDAIVKNEIEGMKDIYMKYVLMVHCITDIKPWCTKKTLSATTYASERKNESTIIDAIKGSEYSEGDKVYLYRTVDNLGWKLAEHFDGQYSWDKYYEKVYNTAQRFKTILDTKSMFPNYKIIKNQKELHEKLGIKNPKPEKEKKPRKKKEDTLPGRGVGVASGSQSM